MSSDDVKLPITYSAVEGIAHIELNRPEVSNAIDLPTAVGLGQAVDLAAADGSIKAVVVTGAGPRFCAGGDVASMLAAADRGPYVEALADTLDQSLQRLAALEKPVLAGVRGAVAGAGLAVMLSCDLIVAGAGTRFVTAYSSVGLTPDCGLSWLLPRALGQQRALELLLSNTFIEAEQACNWGLVTAITPDDEVIDRTFSMARSIANGPAGALGQARRLVRQSWESSRAQTGADEARTIGRAAISEDATALLAAYMK